MTLSILVVKNVRVMSDMLVSQVSKATITDLGHNREKINSLLEDQWEEVCRWLRPLDFFFRGQTTHL